MKGNSKTMENVEKTVGRKALTNSVVVIAYITLLFFSGSVVAQSMTCLFPTGARRLPQ